MHTIEVRVYDTDSEGRRFLLYRPGDVVTAAEAKRVASLVEPKPDTPGWALLMERRKEDLAAAPPALPLDRMNLAELRAVCAAEGIDSDGANTRADFIKVICAARGQRRSNPTNER